MDQKRTSRNIITVAKLNYKFQKNKNKKWGKTFFIASLFVFIFFGAAYFIFSPPELPNCENKEISNCTCPIDKTKIGERSIVLIDITDPLREGKYGDVDRILTEITTSKKSILEWIKNNKKINQISVFALADKDPTDMQPIATFCQAPPDIALIAGDMSAKAIRRMESTLREKISESLNSVKAYSSATSSPIIESLSIITSNSAAWTPGGDLIIISDMLQNSSKCGWFNSMQTIPSFSNVSQECKNYVRVLLENIKPSSTHSNISVIAVCTLPRSSIKPGLRKFWSEIFQEGLQYDITWTCDPSEIHSRHLDLNNKRK